MTLTLHDLPSELDAALRRRAKEERRPIDQIAVEAMKAGLGLENGDFKVAETTNMAAAIRARFAPFGGVELPELVREPIREPVDLGE